MQANKSNVSIPENGRIVCTATTMLMLRLSFQWIAQMIDKIHLGWITEGT
jgi:hypothetical protein